MADNVLISDYLDDLARRLPSEVVAELADGLFETYEHGLVGGLDHDAAARAAIIEFGNVDQVASEFARRSGGRGVARTLLATGPAVGACWGVALMVGRSWTWPIPAVAHVAFGACLLLVIALLVAAATSRIFVALAIAPSFTRIMGLAVAASLSRIALTVRIAPRLVTD
jgi:hypothetical protein